MGGLADLGSSTCGIWTREQALAVTTRGRVDALLARGEWQAPWAGIYADGGYELEPEQRGFAAVLAWAGRTEGRRAYSSRLRRWTFWSRPTASRLANIAEPP